MGKKVVLDTNVWVSILLEKSLSEEFVPLIESKRIDVYLSYELLRELARVLTYPKIDEILRAANVSPESALTSVVKSVKLVRPRHTVHSIREDPTDDRVLECALACKSKTIVSGDHHLLTLKQFRGIRILTPREFLQTI
jgi:putative PIN family toxin of toxin-antitoxin system